MSANTYVAGYRRRASARRAEHETLRRRLVARVEGLGEYFASLPGVRRVYLFGSAATPGRFRPRFDADLAFEGLPAGELPRVLSELVDRLDCSVDAVRIEDAPPPLRERIEAGLVVYER